MAQQQYEANHQPGVRPVAAIRDDPIHVVHALIHVAAIREVPNHDQLQPIEPRQELPSHLDQDLDKWTEFRNFVIRGLKRKTNSFAKTWRTRYTFLVVGLKQSEIIDGVIAAVNAEIQNIPDEYRSTIGEYTCKQCFEYVAEHGQENCQHLIVPNGFHTIRNIKTKPLQHTTLSSHERSRLHKASIGITVTEEDLNVWRAGVKRMANMEKYKCTDPESRKPSEYQLNKKRREKRTKQTNQLLELLSFSLP
eukprot:685804_1